MENLIKPKNILGLCKTGPLHADRSPPGDITSAGMVPTVLYCCRDQAHLIRMS